MRKAFTLIELLIVVAIIAILAAIAVPNFLEAQTRAKVSRCKADQRTLATAIEAYAVDNNHYAPPIDGTKARGASPTLAYGGISLFGSPRTDCVSTRFIWFTTPIAYISSVFPEVFTVYGVAAVGAPDTFQSYDSYDYWTDHAPTNISGSTYITDGRALSSGCKWRVSGVGPDRYQAFGGSALTGSRADVNANTLGCGYDPTNGTVSAGDIVRIGAPSQEGTAPFFDRAQNPSL